MSTKKSQILQWNKSKKYMNLLNIIRTGLWRTGNMLCFQIKLLSVVVNHLEDISTIERRRINKFDLTRSKKQNRVVLGLEKGSFTPSSTGLTRGVVGRDSH